MTTAALTPGDVARALKLSEWTVRQAIRNGHLKKIPHTGRLVRVTPEAVEECFGVKVEGAS